MLVEQLQLAMQAVARECGGQFWIHNASAVPGCIQMMTSVSFVLPPSDDGSGGSHERQVEVLMQRLQSAISEALYQADASNFRVDTSLVRLGLGAAGSTAGSDAESPHHASGCALTPGATVGGFYAGPACVSAFESISDAQVSSNGTSKTSNGPCSSILTVHFTALLSTHPAAAVPGSIRAVLVNGTNILADRTYAAADALQRCPNDDTDATAKLPPGTCSRACYLELRLSSGSLASAASMLQIYVLYNPESQPGICAPGEDHSQALDLAADRPTGSSQPPRGRCLVLWTSSIALLPEAAASELDRHFQQVSMPKAAAGTDSSCLDEDAAGITQGGPTGDVQQSPIFSDPRSAVWNSMMQPLYRDMALVLTSPANLAPEDLSARVEVLLRYLLSNDLERTFEFLASQLQASSMLHLALESSSNGVSAATAVHVARPSRRGVLSALAGFVRLGVPQSYHLVVSTVRCIACWTVVRISVAVAQLARACEAAASGLQRLASRVSATRRQRSGEASSDLNSGASAPEPAGEPSRAGRHKRRALPLQRASSVDAARRGGFQDPNLESRYLLWKHEKFQSSDCFIAGAMAAQVPLQWYFSGTHVMAAMLVVHCLPYVAMLMWPDWFRRHRERLLVASTLVAAALLGFDHEISRNLYGTDVSAGALRFLESHSYVPIYAVMLPMCQNVRLPWYLLMTAAKLLMYLRVLAYMHSGSGAMLSLWLSGALKLGATFFMGGAVCFLRDWGARRNFLVACTQAVMQTAE